MTVTTLSFVKAIRAVYPNEGFTCLTKATISESLDTIEFDDNTIVLDSAAVVAKYDEIEAAQPLEDLRTERNRLIAQTDWWASSDLTMSAERAAYRQALRDITETYTNLNDVVWPVKP